MFKSSIKTIKGMTLIEIMIVIGIIAFLAVLVSSYLRTQIFKSTDARRKADTKRIAIAVEEYEKDNDCYPLSSTVSCNPGSGLKPYIDKIPCDPATESSYMYEHEDSICPKWYKIYAALQNESDGDYFANIGPNGAYSFVFESPNAPETVAVGGAVPQTNFYGCFSGVCTPISWVPERNGTECEPSFQNINCYGACLNEQGFPANQCN